MFKIIKKNQKKFMAVFAAGLMVAFMVPTFFGQGNTSRGDATYGYIGNSELTHQRVQQARNEWDQLKTITIEVPDRQGQPQAEPLAAVLLGGAAVQQINNSPEMFALLQEEAVRMGVGVSSDTVKSVLANTKARYPLDAEGNPDPSTLQAVHGLMLVSGGFDRVAGAAHASRPLRDHQLAMRQEIAVNLVEFNARDYLARLPAVLETKDLQAHFDQYKSFEAGSTATNKWGFGYKVPNKIRVQYLMVEDAKVRAAVEAGLSPVDVAKYYKLHTDKFPKVVVTPKTLEDYHLGHSLTDSQATTQSSIGRFFGHAPPLGVAPLLGYDHYREEVKKAVLAERAADLMKQILGDVTGTMNADYVAFSKATAPAPGAAPTTAPADLPAAGPPSSVGPTYGSKEYLDKLAFRTQEKYKVLPTVQTVGELKTAKELAELPGIGKTSFEMDMNVLMALYRAQQTDRLQDYRQHLQFANYAVSCVEPLMSEADRNFVRTFRVPTLAVYQPSAALADTAQNQYIFRAAEAVAAHPPKSLAEVKAEAEADLRLVMAYGLAAQDAQKFLNTARSQRLQPAAAAANRPVIPTNLFGGEMGLPPDYVLPDRVATNDFLVGVYQTLGSAGGADPQHPVGLIELKEREAARALVAEIAAVKPSWKSEQQAAYQLEVSADTIGRSRAALQAQWFRLDDLEKRLAYRPAAARKSQQPNPQPQQESEPNPFQP